MRSTGLILGFVGFIAAGSGFAQTNAPKPTVDADGDQGSLGPKRMFGGVAPEERIDKDDESGARSPRSEALPKQLNGVGVEEKLESRVPLELEFIDSEGKKTTLGEVLTGDKPVLLTLNYSDCPMLCSVMLNGLVEGLEGMRWTVGTEFDLVTVSLDPNESPERAHSTKERFLTDYGRDEPSIEDGWTFLVGSENNIRALADSVGFGYRYSESRKEYLHAAALMVLNPSGQVSRYLYGITYSPKTIRLSLAEASDGKFASTLDQLILFCFHYDETEGRYAPVARNIMMLGGAATVILLALFLGGFWLRDARRQET